MRFNKLLFWRRRNWQSPKGLILKKSVCSHWAIAMTKKRIHTGNQWQVNSSSTYNFLLFSATSFPYLPMSMINESTKIGWWLLATFSTCWGSRTCDSNKNQPEPWFKPWALQISNDFLRARSSDLLRHGQYNKTNVFSRGCGRYVKKNDLAKGHCQSK